MTQSVIDVEISLNNRIFAVLMKTKKNISLKFIDLFAGCGGLSLGLEQANFDPIFVNELNKNALETY